MGPMGGLMGGRRIGRRIWPKTVVCGIAESRPMRMRIDFIFTCDRVVRNAAERAWMSWLT